MTRTTTSRRLPDASTPGIADARVLPASDFAAAWESIVLPEDMKADLLGVAVAKRRRELAQRGARVRFGGTS